MMQSVRSELALRQIRDSDRSMAELAELLGFSDASAFAYWFRRRFACTVSAWRKVADERLNQRHLACDLALSGS